jgi:hypothetical protein
MTPRVCWLFTKWSHTCARAHTHTHTHKCKPLEFSAAMHCASSQEKVPEIPYRRYPCLSPGKSLVWEQSVTTSVSALGFNIIHGKSMPAFLVPLKLNQRRLPIINHKTNSKRAYVGGQRNGHVSHSPMWEWSTLPYWLPMWHWDTFP